MTDVGVVTEFKTVRVTYTITTMLGEVFTHTQDFVRGGSIMPSDIKERFFKDGYYEPNLTGTLHKVAKISMSHQKVVP